jgi:uncharacterized membrane protein
MKILLSSILASSFIFLIVDIIWLSFAVKSFYRPNLGDLLLNQPVLWAAITFYFVYIVGISILIIHPGVNQDYYINIFVKGFVFGLVAYGTYNLTNMATIKGWSANVVFVDMFWGGFLTGSSCSLGIYLSKKLFD